MYAITSPTPTPQPTPPDPNAYAYQRGIECEQAGRFVEAHEWHSRVASGSRFEEPAIASRIAVLLVVGRAAEAAELGLAALVRLSRPSALLVNEVARAVNIHLGPAYAFTTPPANRAALILGSGGQRQLMPRAADNLPPR